MDDDRLDWMSDPDWLSDMMMHTLLAVVAGLATVAILALAVEAARMILLAIGMYAAGYRYDAMRDDHIRWKPRSAEADAAAAQRVLWYLDASPV